MRKVIPFFVVLAACPSSSDISVEVPKSIPADSSSPITLKASVKFRGLAIADGTDVRFKASAGSFAADKALAEAEIETTGGEARATYFPPAMPGDVELTVSFTNPNRESVSTVETLKILPLPPADAATMSVGCETGNVGALVSGAPRLEITCTLQMRDTAGNAIASQTAQFFTEAGVVLDKGPQANGTRRFSYVIDPGAAPPVDVSANAAELAASDDLSGQLVRILGSREYNPRDGVASVLAVVRGHEQFDDANGNGQFDDGENFTDEGEPFLDVDDDGLLTTSFGDKFLPAFDNNGNGIWDGPNGVYDADVKIGRSTHVLWSGAAVLYAEPATVPQKAPHSPPTVISVFLRDENGNPPAGYDTGDKIELTGSAASNVTITGLVSQPLSADLTMTFDAKSGVFLDLQKDPSTQFPVSRRFNVTVNDGRTQNQIDQAPNGVTVSVQGFVRYTFAPRAASVSARTVNLTKIEFKIQ